MEKLNYTYKWFKIISIPVIGIVMPLFFYDAGDYKRLIMWMIISIVLTFVFWEVGQRVSHIINKKFPIDSLPAKHVIVMLIFFSVLAFFAILFVFLVNIIFGNVTSDYWAEMKGIHIVIILCTFFITALHESIFLFYKWKNSLFITEKLEKENVIAHYEALKNQVNPHFLFNSLGILSSLIQTNPKNALEYVDQFSKTYRYILDVSNKDTVSIKEEMEFINSYIYLHKIRFGDNLQFKSEIKNNHLNKFILPLSLQIPVENAIKHNEISDKYHLEILIYEENNYVIIKNNMNLIYRKDTLKSIGLKNLADRYKFISNVQPKFYKQDDCFIVEIPIVSED